MQPFEKSANSWTWKPCRPGSRPDTVYVIVVGSVPTCSNVIVPTALLLADTSDASHGFPFGATEQVALIVDIFSTVSLYDLTVVCLWCLMFTDAKASS